MHATRTRGTDHAAIIRRLGFTPEESLVLAASPLPPANDGLVARVDLADLAADHRSALLERLGTVLRETGTRTVTVAYFTQRDVRALAVLDADVTQMLTGIDVTRVATILVDTPPNGTTRDQLGRIIPAPEPRRAEVARALENPPPGSLDTYLAALDLHGHRRFMPAPLVASLIGWLDDLHHRDAVLALLIGGTVAEARAVAQNIDPQAAAAAFEGLFNPTHARRPGPQVQRHVEVLTEVVACTPRRHQVPARCLLALAAWWTGNGALAERHLEEAMSASEQPYRLAVLLQHALTCDVPPAWVRREARPN